MIRTRILATLAVAALVCGLARTSDAAIYSFSQTFLMGSTEKASVGLTGASGIDLGFPKLNSAPDAGQYGTGGNDPSVMTYDVGFRGDMEKTGAAPGTLYIGQNIAPLSTGGAFQDGTDFLRAAVSNDNNATWAFGVWVFDSITNTRYETTPQLPLSAPPSTQGIANLDISGMNITQAGFFVRLDTALAGSPFGGDKYHVSIQATDDADILLLPEPTSMLVWGLGLGVFGAVGCYRRRRKAAAV